MDSLTTHWRPQPRLRVKSLALIWRGDEILVCAIPDDTGAIKGWRPLGGTVEFGEHTEITVVRELAEELAATVETTQLLTVIENIYTHAGQQGHEIAFIYTVSLDHAGLASADEFIVDDEGTRFACVWVPVSKFTTGTETLFPDGLLSFL